MGDLRCPQHKDYEGKVPPKRSCDYCWFSFWTKQVVPDCFLNTAPKTREDNRDRRDKS